MWSIVNIALFSIPASQGWREGDSPTRPSGPGTAAAGSRAAPPAPARAPPSAPRSPHPSPHPTETGTHRFTDWSYKSRRAVEQVK